MSKKNQNKNEVLSLREVALSYDQATVDSMVADIRASFDRRDTFESKDGAVSLASKGSYTTERDRMLANEIAVARFFLALNVTASSVIERKVAENAMFNAKALKKVTELAQFTCGYGQRLERVMRAFIACALIATEKGHDVITNDVNRAFLCSRGFGDRIKDQDLIDHLDALRHRAMTSGAETQSSQSRNVLDVLNLGSIRSIDSPRDAIALNADHAFYAQFREAFMN